ncbi:MAG: ABC transporter permease [Chloroflexi bacterium]|nr:ABC transporter permease [Chloroflexota bacterium]
MKDKFDEAIETQIVDATEAPVVRLRSQRKRLFRTFIRNRPAILGVILMLLVVFMALFADDWFIAVFQGRDPQPLLAPYDPLEQDTANRLAPPSREHWMGLDSYGRDMLSRIIYGSRVSLLVGIVSVIIGGVIGALMGLMGGYLGGKTENVLMRAADILMAFPSLIMGLMVLAVLGGGLFNMILAIGIVLAPTFARVAHSSTLSVKQNEYVEAARSIGASNFRIARLHVLPNIVSELVVLASIWIASAIRVEANLSFIGLGVSPPTPAWGSMIRDGTKYLFQAPWVSLFPGLAILITVLAFNLLGDGLRDVLDPKLQN